MTITPRKRQHWKERNDRQLPQRQLASGRASATYTGREAGIVLLCLGILLLLLLIPGAPPTATALGLILPVAAVVFVVVVAYVDAKRRERNDQQRWVKPAGITLLSLNVVTPVTLVGVGAISATTFFDFIWPSVGLAVLGAHLGSKPREAHGPSANLGRPLPAFLGLERSDDGELTPVTRVGGGAIVARTVFRFIWRTVLGKRDRGTPPTPREVIAVVAVAILAVLIVAVAVLGRGDVAILAVLAVTVAACIIGSGKTNPTTRTAGSTAGSIRPPDRSSSTTSTPDGAEP